MYVDYLRHIKVTFFQQALNLIQSKLCVQKYYITCYNITLPILWFINSPVFFRLEEMQKQIYCLKTELECVKKGDAQVNLFLDQRYYLAGCTLCKTHYSRWNANGGWVGGQGKWLGSLCNQLLLLFKIKLFQTCILLIDMIDLKSQN